MLARRLLMFSAVLLGLTALASLIAPSEMRDYGDEGTVAVRSTLPAGKPVEKKISATPRPGAAPTKIVVERGDTLTLEVEGKLFDSVLIERTAFMNMLAPERAARFNLLIDLQPGSYPIRLVAADRRIGSLVVRP